MFPVNRMGSKQHYRELLKELAKVEAYFIHHKDVPAYLDRCEELTGVRLSAEPAPRSYYGQPVPQGAFRLQLPKK